MLSLLRRLEAARLSYRLEQVRDSAISMQVTVRLANRAARLGQPAL
jgi:hypothetical protein